MSLAIFFYSEASLNSFFKKLFSNLENLWDPYNPLQPRAAYL